MFDDVSFAGRTKPEPQTRSSLKLIRETIYSKRFEGKPEFQDQIPKPATPDPEALKSCKAIP